MRVRPEPLPVGAADAELNTRLDERISDWRVVVNRLVETESSIVAFGTRDDRRVVLKVMRAPGDEWRSGEILEAFAGRGMVRAYEYVDGAVLLEHLHPGTSLSTVALSGRDEEATAILADVIRRMSSATVPQKPVATVADWGEGFQKYLLSGNQQLPMDLVEHASSVYAELAASQTHIRLLHGDLQHYNVLLDSERGWLAIDPKGVVGELEYEIGASLRNPAESPDLFASRETIERRTRQFGAALNADAQRILGWGFAQAVLSAIWLVEDGYAVNSRSVPVLVANAISPMLGVG